MWNDWKISLWKEKMKERKLGQRGSYILIMITITTRRLQFLRRHPRQCSTLAMDFCNDQHRHFDVHQRNLGSSMATNSHDDGIQVVKVLRSFFFFCTNVDWCYWEFRSPICCFCFLLVHCCFKDLREVKTEKKKGNVISSEALKMRNFFLLFLGWWCESNIEVWTNISCKFCSCLALLVSYLSLNVNFGATYGILWSLNSSWVFLFYKLIFFLKCVNS